MTQYVVYTLDGDDKPGHFLSVEDSADEAYGEMERWYLAFYNDEKITPNGYNGISYRPVAEFDSWQSPDEDSTFD